MITAFPIEDNTILINRVNFPYHFLKLFVLIFLFEGIKYTVKCADFTFIHGYFGALLGLLFDGLK